MTEIRVFTTREERDAFDRFVEDLDLPGRPLTDRLVAAWDAAREFWVPDKGPTFPPRPNLGLARNEELFGELKARLGMGHTNPKYATVFPNDDGAALDSDSEWFLAQVAGLLGSAGPSIKRTFPDGKSLTFDEALAEIANLERELTLVKFAHSSEIRYLRAKLREPGVDRDIDGVPVDTEPEPTEVTDTGLSEFGRGYEEGKAEASDRQLRLSALQYATQLALAGQIYVKGSQGREGESKYVSFPHPVETAMAMLHFLEGGE